MPEFRGRAFYARWLSLTILLLLSIAVVAPFLIPMALGGIFGVLLHPIHARFRPRRLRPNAAALLSTLGFTLLILIPIAFALFAVVQEGIVQLQDWSQRVAESRPTDGGADGWSARIGVWLRSQPFVDRLVDALPINSAEFLRTWRRISASVGTWLTDLLQNFMGGIPQALVTGVVVFVTVFFCFRDGPRFVALVRRHSPFEPAATERLIRSVHASCRAVVLASFASGAVQATIIGIACLINGTPGVALIAFATFLASFVPLIGTGPVTIGLVVYSLASGDTAGAVVFLVFGGIAGISDNFVRPYVIQGGGEPIHPLLAFVSVFGALGVMGVSGIFIGPIVVSVATRMTSVMIGAPPAGVEPEAKGAREGPGGGRLAG